MPKMRSIMIQAAGLLVALTTSVAAQSDYPEPAGAPDHPVPAGRQQRRGRPHDRHAAQRAARQAGDRRQPRRRRRRGRHRDRDEGGARRLHARRHLARARRQPVALQVALRSDQGVHADRHHGHRPERAGRPSQPAGEDHAGADRAGQEQARRTAIRLRRHRQLPASRQRAVQARPPRSTSCTFRSRAADRR